MGRLTDAGVQVLLGMVHAPAVTLTQTEGKTLERLRSLFADRNAADELGRTLTLDMAAYLNRPVRCSVLPSPGAVTDAWRFSAQVDADRWWLDLDVALAGAFADAMIGGDGTAAVGRGRRVRGLVRRIAERIFAVVADVTGSAAPQPAAEEDPATARGAESGDALAVGGGLYAVAIDQYPWQIGVYAREPAAQAPPPQAARPSAPPIIADESERPAPATVASVIDLLRVRLEHSSHATIDASEPKTSETGEPFASDSPPITLGLALTTDGTGALVALLDRAAVGIVASGASGSVLPDCEAVGDVVAAAAEAVVRDALGDLGLRLPAIASSGQRVVRLADNPLPARTPHHAVDLRVAAGEREGVIRLLIPSWMLAQEAQTSS